jgi:hypothetical protein
MRESAYLLKEIKAAAHDIEQNLSSVKKLADHYSKLTYDRSIAENVNDLISRLDFLQAWCDNRMSEEDRNNG